MEGDGDEPSIDAVAHHDDGLVANELYAGVEELLVLALVDEGDKVGGPIACCGCVDGEPLVLFGNGRDVEDAVLVVGVARSARGAYSGSALGWVAAASESEPPSPTRLTAPYSPLQARLGLTLRPGRWRGGPRAFDRVR